MANKEFDDVQLDVKFTKATALENITSQENISIAFGKLARWFDELDHPEYKINGLSINHTDNRTNYATCSTAAATATKVVSCTGFLLVTGSEITVKFNVTNTAASPTLNVNSTGAKPIYYRGTAISAGYLAANRTYTFRYNGTQYELVGDLNTNTTYSVMTGASASAAGKAGLVPIPAAGKQDTFLKGDGTWDTPTDTKYSVFVKSGSGAKEGLVPSPSTTAGTTKYLCEDGTWKVPTDTNTDTKVTQSKTTTGNYRPILLGYNNNNDPAELETTVTNQAYQTSKAYIQPSTGNVYTTGDIYVDSGIFATNGDPDSSGHTALICHNGSNVWIGSRMGAAAHHTGRTYISTGYDGTNNVGYDTILIAVPNTDNTNAVGYGALHTGNTYHNITSSDDLWSTIGISTSTNYALKVLRGGIGSSAVTPPAWFAGKYGAGIAFGGSDSKGVLSMLHTSPKVTFAAGYQSATQTKPVWHMHLTGTSTKTYNLDNFSTTSHIHDESGIVHSETYVSKGDAGEISSAKVNVLAADRLAFIPASNITIENTSDGGSTWTDSGYENLDRATIFGSGLDGDVKAVGPNTTAERTTNMKTRVTITNDGRDCNINQFFIMFSTFGHVVNVDIQYATGAARTTFVNWRTGVTLGGWPGPNVINVSSRRFSSRTSVSEIYAIRFVFNITSVRSDYKTTSSRLYGIQAFSDVMSYTSATNMDYTGHLYSWDINQNMYTPKEIRIPSQMRIVSSSNGLIIRNDGNNSYLLVTDDNDAYGNFNTLRPLYVNNNTGRVTMQNGLYIKTGTSSSSTFLTLQGTTTASNTYNSDNPKIRFMNSRGDQNGELVWNDYDSVLTPASLTLIGNLAGTYFVAPRLRLEGTSATNSIIDINDPGNKGFNIHYRSSTRSSAMIGFHPNDTNGSGIHVGQGSGGLTIISSGESGSHLESTLFTTDKNPYGTTAWTWGNEECVMAADGNLYFISGANSLTTSAHTDWTNLKTALFDTSGAFRPSIDNKGSLGAVSYRWGRSFIDCISTPKVTTTYLNGNKTGALIQSSATAGSYVMLAKMNSTNGYFTHGTYQKSYILQYTAKTTVDADTNAVTKAATLLDESGNSSFPETVSASKFKVPQTGCLYQVQDDYTHSKFSQAVKWYAGSAPETGWPAGIGRHNTGGDETYKGAISILPYETTTSPLNGTVGLFIRKGHVSIDGTELVQKTSAYMSAMCNLLSEASATPTDNDYYIAQYSGGGTTNTTYYRRKTVALWNYIKGKADTTYAAKSHTHSYLPLAGGTITGTIKYNSGTKTSPLFYIDDGDANGSMYSGPHTDGLTILGSGESPENLRNAILSEDGLVVPGTTSSKFLPTLEHTILSSDINIYFMTNCNAIANKKVAILSSTLSFYPSITETGSVGTSTHEWNSMYAKTFYGALSGNASSATQVTSTLTEPTTATRYYLLFHNTSPTTTGAKSIRHNNSLCCHDLEGTTTTDGYTYLELGNITPSGTAGNSYGVLRICAKNDKYQNILPNTISANTNITLPASSGTLALTSSNITGSSAKWTTARNINGLSIDGSTNRFNYGICSTAAATATKTVNCTGFAGGTGSEITVKFTVTNKAANPTLNVNSTGAKPIYYRGAAVSAGYLAANRTYTFRFNGTQYELVGDLNTNTTYSNMTAATASAAGKSGLVPAPAAGAQSKFLRGDGTWQTPTNTDTKVTVTDLTVNPSTNTGIIRPLLFAASTANPSNELESADGEAPNSSVSKTYTGGINMTGGIYIKTNYWTTGGSGGYVELHVPNGYIESPKFKGIADSAEKLKTVRTINGVDFDGTENISITKCLYSGTGATAVNLMESQSNYDILIVVTNVGTFLHRVGSTYTFHPYCTYPKTSSSGANYVNLGNLSINSGTDKRVSVIKSDSQLRAAGTTITSQTSTTITIKEVYGLKLS